MISQMCLLAQQCVRNITPCLLNSTCWPGVNISPYFLDACQGKCFGFHSIWGKVLRCKLTQSGVSPYFSLKLPWKYRSLKNSIINMATYEKMPKNFWGKVLISQGKVLIFWTNSYPCARLNNFPKMCYLGC